MTKAIADLANNALLVESWFDAVTNGYNYGLAADRPSGAAGMVWFSTDTLTLSYHDGTGWIILDEPWQSYNTYATTNITVGNGTKFGEYKREAGRCHYKGTFTLGSTSAIGAAPTIGLPIAYNGNAQEIEVSEVMYYNGTRARGNMFAQTTTSFGLNAWGSAGAYVVDAALGAAVPFAWANGNVIVWAVSYRMTTKYS